jgi:hypothetical protein
MEIQSDLTAIMVAIPMLAIMAAGIFRLDESLGKPRKKVRRVPLAAGLDEYGVPIGIDPDGQPIGRRSRR